MKTLISQAKALLDNELYLHTCVYLFTIKQENNNSISNADSIRATDRFRPI